MSNFPALKINRHSRFIKKPSPPPPPSPPLPPRHPVIIYTHSPKVIRTHPKDFMALVQKLTGFSPPASPPASSPPTPPPPQSEPEPEPEPELEPDPCEEYMNTEMMNNNSSSDTNYNNRNDGISAENNGRLINEDKGSTSVVMDEKGGSCSIGHDFDSLNNNNNSNSFDNNEFMNNKSNNKNSMPYFYQTSLDFRCSGPPFGNCGDSLFSGKMFTSKFCEKG